MSLLDPRKNFAKVTVSTGYNASATSIALTAGHGARLPVIDDGEAFNLVWWNATDYSDPTDDPNVEIVRVSAIATDTLSIARAQEGTSAQTHNISGRTYKMILAITKKMIDDIEADLAASAWVIDYQPPQALAGNAVFTIPVPASQIIVYADGQRVKGNGVTYTFSDDDTITFVAGLEPYSSLSVDYLPV